MSSLAGLDLSGSVCPIRLRNAGEPRGRLALGPPHRHPRPPPPPPPPPTPTTTTTTRDRIVSTASRPITSLCVDTIRSRGLRWVVTATVTGRRGEEDAASLFCNYPIINLQKSLEMYTWGRNVRLGSLPQTCFSPPRTHFAGGHRTWRHPHPVRGHGRCSTREPLQSGRVLAHNFSF